MNNKITRKKFLKKASILTLGFAGLSNYLLSKSLNQLNINSLQLVKDSNKILDLPYGFSYKIISKFGNQMSDGLQVPNHADGMGCFAMGNDIIALIRNHELGRFEEFNFKTDYGKSAFAKLDNDIEKFYPRKNIYDNCNDGIVCFGGTTTIIYNTKTSKVENEYLSLAGTLINCSGGITPWGTWISCEETMVKNNKFLLKDHGYNFEVTPSLKRKISNAIPIKQMGRFRHEAVAFDQKSGAVYQTEDRKDGMIYRYLPNQKMNLLEGGRLQALAFKESPSLDTRNWRKTTILKKQTYNVEWINIDNVESPNDDLRYQGFEKGCAQFARPEGMWEHDGKIFFTCTTGGKKQLGQIWKYTPSPYEGTSNEIKEPAKLELFFESNDSKNLDMCDNITVSPWGDIIICEDGGGVDFLIGIKPDGTSYKIAKNALNNSEFAGACFSPDGNTLFVNIYKPTITLAITGPWDDLI